MNQRELLSRNQGRTAEDLIGRYYQGAQSEGRKAEKYQIKSDAFETAAGAIDYLRSRLTEIADEGNKEIDDVLASNKPLPEQIAEIQAIQARCNADAANASRNAVDKIMVATQKILEAEDIGRDARTWARANGFSVDDAPPASPISKDDLDVPPALGCGIGGPGSSDCGPVAGGETTAPALGVGTGGPGSGGSQIGTQVSGLPPRAIGPTGGPLNAGPVPSAPPVATPAGGGPPMVGPGVPAAPAMPGAPSLSPAAVGQGVSPGSIGQSLATGMVTGQPAAAGAQSLSEGAMSAIQSGSAPAPQAAAPMTAPAPPAPLAMAAGIESAATHGPVDAPSNTPTPAGVDRE
ncbi:hypothetical protein [Mycobacterium lacus]